MLKKILIALGGDRCRVCRRRCHAALRVPRRADGHHRRPAGGGVCAGERFPQVGGMVPVGETRSGDEETFEGAPAGTGAIYTWAGNNEVGEGRMTIDGEPSERTDPNQT